MASIERMRMHTREELETWIATLEDAREELEQLVGVELGLEPEALDVLEAFLLKRYPSIAAALTLDQRGVIDAASRHVGLALILNVEGARWDIDLENERNVYYRYPIIALPDGSQECPLMLATAALDRRTGTYMSEVVTNIAEDCAPKKKPRRAKAKPAPKKRKKR